MSYLNHYDQNSLLNNYTADELKKTDENIKEDLEAIISSCKKNNRASQKMLYDRCFEGLYVHCQSYRLTDQDKVFLINTTMLKVFQKIGSYKGEGAFDSWVHTIHKNVILSHFRSMSRQRSYMTYDSDTVSAWGAQNGGLDKDVDLEYLLHAMESLPEQTREVLELYAVQGYKHKEIARMLDMSESNSKYHLGKAREMIANKLKRNHG